ncbi:hypothetical protein F5Y16DRAFT_394866 [Xylariaceae sp. FL0255]|nr:hypothetical protein F5Y16DRAFT_394866 [Xylariaceae sp. FL0255]
MVPRSVPASQSASKDCQRVEGNGDKEDVAAEVFKEYPWWQGGVLLFVHVAIGRSKFAHSLDTSEGHTTVQPLEGDERYDDMHKYLRHVTHTTRKNDDAHSNVSNGLQFSFQFLSGWKLLDDTFRKRLGNEIRLAFNVVSLTQLQDTKRLLERTESLLKGLRTMLKQTRDNGRAMMTTVTALTLIFLPVSIASGF